MHYHPDHTRRSGLKKFVNAPIDVINNNRINAKYIPSDVVLIGSGTLAGDLGGIFGIPGQTKVRQI